MAEVVHPDQTCGVPGRMCGMNLALIRDAWAWAEQRQVSMALLSPDQEKPFDRVSHTLLFALLERMGFGPGFVAMVRLLYAGANHWRREPTFQGLHVPGVAGIRAKLSVFADDPTLFLGRDEDFVVVGHVLEPFSEAFSFLFFSYTCPQPILCKMCSQLSAVSHQLCPHPFSVQMQDFTLASILSRGGPYPNPALSTSDTGIQGLLGLL
ncbi:CMP-N-acetylneuraminate-beta-galactosamide-alpha-2,3-sialyltransferase 1-like [Tachysurus ichikawai]